MRPIRSMVFPSRSPILLALVLIATLVVVGCQPKSPEEQVADARSRYIVELNSWFPKVEEPPAEEMVDGEAPDGEATDDVAADDEAPAEDATEGDAADGEAADGDAAEGEAMADAGPVTTSIFFDLIVKLDGNDSLPGLTLDLSQAAADGTEKKAWKRYVELPEMIKGETQQVSFEEELEFAEGDQFSVQLRSVVAPEDRGEYREFAAAAAGG